jgi:hypothetical protein
MQGARPDTLDRIRILDFVARQEKVPLILGWQLSRRARETMASQLRPRVIESGTGALDNDPYNLVALLLGRTRPGL